MLYGLFHRDCAGWGVDTGPVRTEAKRVIGRSWWPSATMIMGVWPIPLAVEIKSGQIGEVDSQEVEEMWSVCGGTLGPDTIWGSAMWLWVWGYGKGLPEVVESTDKLWGEWLSSASGSIFSSWAWSDLASPSLYFLSSKMGIIIICRTKWFQGSTGMLCAWYLAQWLIQQPLREW